MQIDETLISISRKQGDKSQQPVRLKIWRPVDGLRSILKEQENRGKTAAPVGKVRESRVVVD